MPKVDWAALTHEFMDHIANMSDEEWDEMMERYRYVSTEEDERVNKLFANTVVSAIDKGDIETEDICNALDVPLHSVSELNREIYSALDEYFQEIFGMRMKEAW